MLCGSNTLFWFHLQYYFIAGGTNAFQGSQPHITFWNEEIKYSDWAVSLLQQQGFN